MNFSPVHGDLLKLASSEKVNLKDAIMNLPCEL